MAGPYIFMEGIKLRTRLIAMKANPENGERIRPIIEQTGKGDLLCYESSSGRWFRSSNQFVEDRLAELNAKANNDNFDTIGCDELFRSLKLYSISRYLEYGWWLKMIPFGCKIFKTKLYQNGFQDIDEPVLCIYESIPPIKGYYKEEV